MKIAAYSEAKQEWERIGENIQYLKTVNGPYPKRREYYTLSFTYTFEFDSDAVYFAYSYPYTYSHLKNLLHKAVLTRNAVKSTLCKTIAGYNCSCLTITSGEQKKKQGIVLTARVHPGETVGSWMMHGAINFLVSNDPVAIELRSNYVFKVVPMLNPDGVIQGNYRTSLMGCDLNRRYLTPSKVSSN